MNRLRELLTFILISGLGWMLDLGVFISFVKLFNFSTFFSNFISSYIGVTFVWFISIRSIFHGLRADKINFLTLYWVYQFVSIIAYSSILYKGLLIIKSFGFIDADIYIKILITPINLLTNYLFMLFLNKFILKFKTSK